MTFPCVVNLALVPDGLQTRASGGARDDLEHLRDIDRSEHITTAYEMKDGVLTSRSVDWHADGWRHDGGAHSFGHRIEFCREHLARGARALGSPDRRA